MGGALGKRRHDKRRASAAMFREYQSKFDAQLVPVMSLTRCARLLEEQLERQESFAMCGDVVRLLRRGTIEDESDVNNERKSRDYGVAGSSEGRGTMQLVLIDCRTRAERQLSHIPGAISQDEFDTRIKQSSSDEQLQSRSHIFAVCYCTVGYRSGCYTKKLNQAQVVAKAYNMEGSILGWVHRGLPLVRNGQIVKELHVFGAQWDMAPPDLKTIKFPLM